MTVYIVIRWFGPYYDDENSIVAVFDSETKALEYVGARDHKHNYYTIESRVMQVSTDHYETDRPGDKSSDEIDNLAAPLEPDTPRMCPKRPGWVFPCAVPGCDCLDDEPAAQHHDA